MIQGMIHLPQMDWLTAFGLLAVCLMLIFYANEKRSPWFVLAFAGSCVMGSAYGFLQGAWPFGLIEGVWSVVAIRRWYQSRIKFEPAPTICENNVNEFFAELQTVAKPAERGHYAFPGADGSINGFVQFIIESPRRLTIHRLWSLQPGRGNGSKILRAVVIWPTGMAWNSA